ncbi:MAG: succinyl-diaminopimelate desuccinylase [Methanomassiliicoccales archaeon PtaU1.Bin124]|nr:MAG: succinyl-diaminopimelate desuccinylase [Methanomassiliicoccales archaeon PtaU1.Bin124]
MDRNVTETLIDLLLIESDHNAKKKEMIDYVVGWLKTLGLEVDLVGDPNNPAISAYNGYNGLALSGHLDTVPIGSNWTMEQGEVEGNRIYGRGAVDMKGACACMLHAAKALMSEDIDFYVLFTTDEEVRMTGARSLLHTHAVKNASGIVIGEPTDLKVAYKEKGVSQFDLYTYGRTAHASMPQLGDNAIMRMYRLLGKVDEYAQEARASGKDLTIGVNVIHGGDKSNVIPDQCHAEIDVRVPFPLKSKEVEAGLRQKFKGHEFELRVPHEVPAFQTDPGSPLITSALEQLGTQTIEVPYATEAAVYCTEVKDILICGPGAPSLAHAPDEFVEKDALQRALDLYIRLAKQAAQG